MRVQGRVYGSRVEKGRAASSEQGPPATDVAYEAAGGFNHREERDGRNQSKVLHSVGMGRNWPESAGMGKAMFPNSFRRLATCWHGRSFCPKRRRLRRRMLKRLRAASCRSKQERGGQQGIRRAIAVARSSARGGLGVRLIGFGPRSLLAPLDLMMGQTPLGCRRPRASVP